MTLSYRELHPTCGLCYDGFVLCRSTYTNYKEAICIIHNIPWLISREKQYEPLKRNKLSLQPKPKSNQNSLLSLAGALISNHVDPFWLGSWYIILKLKQPLLHCPPD